MKLAILLAALAGCTTTTSSFPVIATEDIEATVDVTVVGDSVLLEIDVGFDDVRHPESAVYLADDDVLTATFRGQTYRLAEFDPEENPTGRSSELFVATQLDAPVHANEVITLDYRRGSYTSATLTTTLVNAVVLDPVADVRSSDDLVVTWTPADNIEMRWTMFADFVLDLNGTVADPSMGTLTIPSEMFGEATDRTYKADLTLVRLTTLQVGQPFAGGSVVTRSVTETPFSVTF